MDRADSGDLVSGKFVSSTRIRAGCQHVAGSETPVVHRGPVLAFDGEHDDGTVVAGCRFSQALGEERALISWDLGAPAADIAWTLPKASSEMVSRVRLTADGSRIIDNDGIGMRITDAKSGAVLAEASELDADNITDFDFSPDGSVVAVIRWSGDIDLLRSEDLSLIRRVGSSTGTVNDTGLSDGFPALAISPDNGYVAAWHWKLGVEIWNAESGESLAVLDGRRDYRPPAPGDRGSAFYAGGLAGYDSIRFPSVVLDFDDDGSRLRLAVRQDFVQDDGDGAHPRRSRGAAREGRCQRPA